MDPSVNEVGEFGPGSVTVVDYYYGFVLAAGWYVAAQLLHWNSNSLEN